MGPAPRVPFQRAMSMDGKLPGGPGGPGRRPMLIKQENMMGSPDGYPGNMGVCLNSFTQHIPVSVSVPSLFVVCVPQFRSFTIFQFKLIGNNRIMLRTKTGLHCCL